MHDWLVGLVLEITVPTTSESFCGPCFHRLELFLGRSNLDAGVNAVGGEWSRAFDVPLVEGRFLDGRVAADEVIKTLGV